MKNTDIQKPRCASSPHCSHNTNGRDLSLPCSISFPATTQKADWENGFVERYMKRLNGKDMGDIIVTIRELLAHQRKEDMERALAVLEKYKCGDHKKLRATLSAISTEGV